MSVWTSLLDRWRLGRLSREQLLRDVDQLLAQSQTPQSLLAAMHDEMRRAPISAADLAMLEARIAESSDKTLLRNVPSNDDRTQLLSKGEDATFIIGAEDLGERQRAPAVDSVLLGRFKLVQLVGEGGMSSVYKAIDLRRVEAGAHDPHLAVKVLTFQFSDYFSSI